MLPKNASTVLQLTRNKVYAEQIIRWGTNCVNGCLIKLLWNNYESCQSDFDVNTKQKEGKHPFLRFLQSSIFYFRRYLFAHFWCSYGTLKTCDSCCENQQSCLLTWADFIKRAATFDPATRVNKGGRHSYWMPKRELSGHVSMKERRKLSRPVPFERSVAHSSASSIKQLCRG